MLLAGVVDEDYRGNVGVVLFNFSKETFEGELCCLKGFYDAVMFRLFPESPENGGYILSPQVLSKFAP